MRAALGLPAEDRVARNGAIRRRIEMNFSVSQLADRTLAALGAVVNRQPVPPAPAVVAADRKLHG
jgi:hypothetical protein